MRLCHPRGDREASSRCGAIKRLYSLLAPARNSDPPTSPDTLPLTLTVSSIVHTTLLMSDRRRRTSTPAFKPIPKPDHVRAVVDLTRRKRNITLRSQRNGRLGGKQDVSSVSGTASCSSSSQAGIPQASGSQLDSEDVQMLDSLTATHTSGVGPGPQSHQENIDDNSSNHPKTRKRRRAAVSTPQRCCDMAHTSSLSGPRSGLDSSTRRISGRNPATRGQARV